MKIKIHIAHFEEPIRYGAPLPTKKQISITLDGLRSITDLLQGMGVKASFTISPKFDTQNPSIAQSLQSSGHTVVISDGEPVINYWRSLHIMPVSIVAMMVRRGKVLEFNAWEFSSKVEYNKDLRLPFIMRYNAGSKLTKRLALTIVKLKK